MSNKLALIKQAVDKAKPLFVELFGEEKAKKRITNESMFAVSLCRKMSALAQCNPNTIRDSVFEIVNMGLTLNPSLGQAYLVPFKGTCTTIVGYQGLCTLAYRSGIIKKIESGVVHQGDLFDYQLGDEGYITHKIGPDTDEDDPNYIFVWVRIELATGGVIRVVKNKKWVEKRKAVSKSANVWNTWHVEMAKKTVLRNALKGVPKSPELEEAIFKMDQQETRTPEDVAVEIMDGDPMDVPEPVEATETVEEPVNLFEQDKKK